MKVESVLRSELIKWDYTGIGGEEAVCAAEADAAWSSKRAWSAGVRGARALHLCTQGAGARAAHVSAARVRGPGHR